MSVIKVRSYTKYNGMQVKEYLRYSKAGKKHSIIVRGKRTLRLLGKLQGRIQTAEAKVKSTGKYPKYLSQLKRRSSSLNSTLNSLGDKLRSKKGIRSNARRGRVNLSGRPLY